MNDSLKFKNTVSWVLYGESGDIKETGHVTHNQVQDKVCDELIDVLSGGSATFLGEIATMSIGDGSGQARADDTLGSWSVGSHQDLSVAGLSQTSAHLLSCVTTFTYVSGTMTEAGLFVDSSGSANMYFYDDSMSVVMTPSDSLQITWTIAVDYGEIPPD